MNQKLAAVKNKIKKHRSDIIFITACVGVFTVSYKYALHLQATSKK